MQVPTLTWDEPLLDQKQQNGPRSARLLTAQPINKDADKGGDGQSRKGGGGVGGAGRVSWHEADALSPIDPFVSASN